MKRFSYSIEVPKELGLYSKPIVSKFIETLTDPRSWKGHQFEFVSVQSPPSSTLRRTSRHVGDVPSQRLGKVQPNSKNHIRIIFARNVQIKNTCGFTGLSCADTINKIVYINERNWRCPPKVSGLSLQEYRTYLILHEIGHIIGKNHPIKCGKVGTKMDVMTQQTLGKCTKINTKNVWP